MYRNKRQILKFNVKDPVAFREKCAAYAQKFDYVLRLENHNLSYPFDPFKNILAFGAVSVLSLEKTENAFEKLKDYRKNVDDWIFGNLSYDLKNDTERLISKNPDHKGFPELLFFQPEHIFLFSEDEVCILSFNSPEDILKNIETFVVAPEEYRTESIDFKCDLDKSQYLDIIQKLRSHIYEGDVYEINYCLEYYGECQQADSYSLWQKLCRSSPTPFATYFRAGDYHLICASPERFIRKTGEKVISQPIKGTIAAGDSPEEKKLNADRLRNNEKERAENMMIVDLVRNDLARTSRSGTVKVEELFGIYEFRHLYHMISTVSSVPKEGKDPVDIIKNAFPMGSMTGAPKIKVMELIEDYESGKRGIFSGSVGYFSPDGDFDFNVIIRSLFYNRKSSTLSYNVGGAITYDSDPEMEYRECQLKAKAIRDIFEK